MKMTDAEYFAHKAWSNSQLKLLPNEPELFHGRYVTGIYPQETTKAMELGTMLHAAVLLGEPLPIIPADVLNKDGHCKGGAWLEWKAQHDEPCLKEADAEPLVAMMNSIQGNPAAAQLLAQPGATEEPLFFEDRLTGLPLKGKVDKIAEFPDGLVVIDLKTTSDPSADGFAKSAASFKYHRQAAFYTDLVTWTIDPPEAFIFICVRNVPPYECVVYECSEEMLRQGREENTLAKADLKRRLETGDWHGASHGKVEILDLPRWARS